MKKIHEMTDEELALAYIDGNNRAFDLLLERNQSRLFSYILFVVRRHDVANDLFQETFVKIITKLQENKYTDSGKFRAWMMRIAHNVIMDWFRTKKNDRIVEPSETNDLSNISSRHLLESNIEDFYVNEQVLADVKRMMELLPDTQREVAYMSFYQCLSFKEIAETTGVSINTALGRMRYAILNMRRMAKENGVVLQTD